MFNLGTITSDDEIVIGIAVDEFLKNGHKLTNEKKVADLNKKSALSLKKALEEKRLPLSGEQLRILYISLVSLQEDIGNATALGFPDANLNEKFTSTFEKFLPALEELFDN